MIITVIKSLEQLQKAQKMGPFWRPHFGAGEHFELVLGVAKSRRTSLR